MTTSNTTIDDTRTYAQSPTFHRVNENKSISNYIFYFIQIASLTCRGLTANTGERIIRRARPMLPIRPTRKIKKK